MGPDLGDAAMPLRLSGEDLTFYADWNGMTDLHGLIEMLREEFAVLLRFAVSGASAA